MTSMILHKFQGVITNRASVKKFFDSLPEGAIVLKAEHRKKRSLNQNDYLHGVLIPEFRNALNSVGYDEVKNDAQAKLIMKSMFLTDAVTNKETGEVISYVKDTHDLTTIEMNALIDEVIKFAAENMNYQISYPNEQLNFFSMIATQEDNVMIIDKA